MLQPGLFEMPKFFADKNNSNDLKCTALKKALFYAVSKGFLFYFQARLLSVKHAEKGGKSYKNTVKKNLEDRENP